MTKRKELKLEDVLDSYLSGTPLRQMAKELHVDVSRIHKILDENNVPDRKNAIDEKSIVDYYCAPHGLVDTARHFHVDVQTVNKALSNAGIEKRSLKEANRIGGKFKHQKALDGYDIDKIISMYNDSYSVDQIAKELHIGTTGVKSVLEESGIELRGKDANKIIKLQKTRSTCRKKYGVNNPFQVKEYRDKAKATCLEKYGSENILSLESTKNKIKQTCIEKYGVENPWLSKEVLDKRSKTFVERYGFENPSQSNEIKNKVSETVMDRYGVPYACLTPQCSEAAMSNDSKPNLEFIKLLERNNIGYSREFAIDNYRYDFKVGDILIEINPSWTHSISRAPFGLDPIDKNYHKQKTLVAEEHGYRCIHIWDWDNKEAIIRLLSKRQRIYARDCKIDINVSKSESDLFLNVYHVQGSAKDSIRIGLRYNENLVGIMTFGKPRMNKKYEYELIRYASSADIIGGAEKIWSHFLKDYSPTSVVSYCDRSKFSGEKYFKLGFNTTGIFKPSRHWINKKHHFTDNLVRQRGFDQLLGKEFGEFGKGTSNEELLRQSGFLEVYDAGQQTFIWKGK